MKSKRKPTAAVRNAAEFVKRAQAIKSSWIPMEMRLPDSVAEIERGRTPKLTQAELFPESTMQRLRAIKANEVTR